jgi:hypothetical protein
MAEFLTGFVLAFLPTLVLGVLIGMSLYRRSGNW